VTRVVESSRRSVLEMTASAFASHGTSGSTHRSARERPLGVPSAKRSAEELEAVSQRFVAFVQKHPGLRIEQINKELGTTTSELALPIRKSIARGSIRCQGRRRSTKYFASLASRN